MRASVHGPGRATAVRFSSTVSDLKMLRSCGTQPIPARARWSARSGVMSRPSRPIRPARKRVTPTIELIRVVLPMPLRPSSASDWPSAGDGERDLEQTLLAVGQIAGALVHHVGEVEAGEDFDDFLDHLGIGADQTPPVRARAQPFGDGQPDGLERRKVEKQLVDLKGAR